MQAEADTGVAGLGGHLHLDHGVQPVGTGAAIGLGHGGAQESMGAGLAPDFPVDIALLLPALVEGSDLALAKALVAVAKGLVVG